ncbi:MAG: PilZ domain-containing protein [Syntrophus sp. (in: bacteria)]
MIPTKTSRSDRKYQRYDLDYDGDALSQIKVMVEGDPVQLVNFSLGGLYFISMQRFSSDSKVNVSIDFGNRGKIELSGTVVQVRKEEDSWGVAVDFSKIY